MYYLLDFSIVDEKKDMRLRGIIYNKDQVVVNGIFDKGNLLKEKEIGAPFVIILDEKASSIKNRKQNDKISISVEEAGFLFLVSLHVQGLFEKLKVGNVQYFDVAIKGSGLKIDDYKIINIVDRIDCIDYDASDIEYNTDGGINGIDSLVLKVDNIPKNKELFLLGGRTKGIIVASKKLKDAIEHGGLTGFQFIELENAGAIY